MAAQTQQILQPPPVRRAILTSTGVDLSKFRKVQEIEPRPFNLNPVHFKLPSTVNSNRAWSIIEKFGERAAEDSAPRSQVSLLEQEGRAFIISQDLNPTAQRGLEGVFRESGITLLKLGQPNNYGMYANLPESVDLSVLETIIGKDLFESRKKAITAAYRGSRQNASFCAENAFFFDGPIDVDRWSSIQNELSVAICSGRLHLSSNERSPLIIVRYDNGTGHALKVRPEGS